MKKKILPIRIQNIIHMTLNQRIIHIVWRTINSCFVIKYFFLIGYIETSIRGEKQMNTKQLMSSSMKSPALQK